MLIEKKQTAMKPMRKPLDLTPNARQVLEKRYLRRGADGKPIETPEEMFWRVASHVAAVESHYGNDANAVAEEFYDLLTTLRFFPNSPTFTGAGTPLGQLAACFVLGLKDDMGKDPTGIFSTLRAAALIQQTGGGNGFAFSRLRPKGDTVNASAGVASGPIGFLRVYDTAFGEVAQGGTRRGANMAVLRVDHPDIFDFIRCKAVEGQITNFNISVGITDAFMRACENDETFDLKNPRDGQVWRTVRARELFDEIVKYAHHNGEPGALFLDAANRTNPLPHLYELEATNPCFVGSTRIATDLGLMTIEELAESGAEFLVATDRRAPFAGQERLQRSTYGVAFRPSLPAWKTRKNTPVMRLITSHGYSVTATPDHKFLTTERGYAELSQLRPGERLLLQSGEGIWSKDYRLPNVERVQVAMSVLGRGGDHRSGALVTRQDFAAQYSGLPTEWSHALGLVVGWLIGDGWLSPQSNSPVGMLFDSDSDDEAREIIYRAMREWFGDGHVHQRDSVYQLTYGRLPYEFFSALGVLSVHAPSKRVPLAIWRAPREAVIGFLQSLFATDGTVNVSSHKKSCSIRLASSSQALLEDVQLLLLNFGIVSKIYKRREAGYRRMPDGRRGHKLYFTQTNYELLLDKINRDRFVELVGFIDPQKQEKAQAYIRGKTRRSYAETFETRVISVETSGQADVFDLTEPQTHSVIANGIVCHQCGEQWLGPYENCCLGSINLARHVTFDGKVDWRKLEESTVLATRFLDNVVDANKYVPAVPQLREAALRARRIGLGIMGLGDMMYALGTRYGSAEGEEVAAQVMEFIHYHSMKTSVQLAKERGPFLAIQGSIFDPANLKWTPPTPLTPYTRDFGRPVLDWNLIVNGIKQHGIRNAADTTIAPTGTIATVAGVESYGCEPVFALAYVRHFNDHGQDVELQYTSPLFEQALIEAGVDASARQRIIEQVNVVGSCQNIPEVPDSIKHTFVVASDITPEEHVRMQAALQRFLSNSLSKTCNFPPTATTDDVAKAYFMAWKLGCKGLTVYVAGTREKVVLETQATRAAKEKAQIAAPARAAIKPRPQRLYGTTLRVESPLGTAFVTINSNGAHGDEPFEVFVNVGKAGSDVAADAEAIGRLISLALRSSPQPRETLKEIADQLSGIGGGRSLGFGQKRVRSLADAVAQVLNEYLGAEPTDAPAEQMPLFKVGDICPECGVASLVNEEGCQRCYSCGYSEC